MDAGLDMRCVPLSIPLAVMRPRVLARTAAFPSSSSSSSAAQAGNAAEGKEEEEEEEGLGQLGEGSVLVLDPTAEEEKEAAATMVSSSRVKVWGLVYGICC
jgi:hypothetical protein